jgi:hypothetical protein
MAPSKSLPPSRLITATSRANRQLKKHELTPDQLKDRYFRFAGREATAAYQIASWKTEKDEAYTQQNIFYEPFTYWDWYYVGLWQHDSRPEDDDDRKRRLLWERERGFKANGASWSSYPSPEKRWMAFQRRIKKDKMAKSYVKRIALADWMSLEDLKWVADNLLELEALDLSLFNVNERLSWAEISEELQTSYRRGEDGSTKTFLECLKWLGLRKVRPEAQSDGPFEALLPMCTSLEIFSIRNHSDPYAEKIAVEDLAETEPAYLHDFVCRDILAVTENVANSVTTIALRYHHPCLPYFLEQLRMRKPTIKRVGIDLGAWIQLYPDETEHTLASETSTAGAAAFHGIIDTSLEWLQSIAHRVASDGNVDLSPDAASHSQTTNEANLAAALEEKRTRDQANEKMAERAAYEARKVMYYRDVRLDLNALRVTNTGALDGNRVQCALDDDPTHASTREVLAEHTKYTLQTMLRMLHRASQVEGMTLFPLEPEARFKSNNPIHPLALHQRVTDHATIEMDFDETCYADMAPIYEWLHKEFKWRPVFDWDWFMVPEKMEQLLEPRFRAIDDELGLKRMFQQLNQAGVPVHVLIGRRHDRTNSSCYWGWPYSSERWQKWIEDRFNCNLGLFAEYIDTLSIYYDLRNPLDKERLEKIETLQPYEWPHAKCPKVPCPWHQGEERPAEDFCPFITQRTPLRNGKVEKPQKMANKKSVKNDKPQVSTKHEHLANNCTSAPPVGENANDWPYDSDSDASQSTSNNLHRLAREAAFTREAVGWQKFWYEYSHQFNRLTELHIRMPKCFDKVCSLRLAKLLDRNAGWEIIAYTDEREHVQTDTDHSRLIPGVDADTYEHEEEPKRWPGGRFVRRSWIWPKKRMEFKPSDGPVDKDRVSLEGKRNQVPMWAQPRFAKSDMDETFQREQEEFKKAVARAEEATRREQEAEAELLNTPDIAEL